MKKLVVMLIVAAFVGTAFVAVASDNGPAEVKYEVKMGTVTFNHTAHQGLTDCATCHHTEGYAACKSCHDGTKAPKAKDAYHKNCKDCHKEKGQGPTKCKECHVK
ncbi:MAG: hypothetical protein C0622_09735 [Desulfuromonas sp.]|nr:MAG: hypothetical protein C0622_09735 [Desulfuromonas sp.]